MINYNLDKNSIVFDLGGYKGEFAEKIYKKYNSNIYIFEPVKEYFKILETKFKNNEKIKIFNFGLSNKEEEIEISLNNDGSSTFIKNGEKEIIKLKDIISFLNKNSIKEIDLFKINIEGGEFEVLPALIENDFIKNIGNLQIQFHNFINNAETKRDSIQKELIKITYNYLGKE